MPLSSGDQLGPYEIVSAIGAGGMGEVYKARDTRLDRTVAIKVLPEHIAQREDLRARFEREARAVASLNHPNICTLHDIGPGYMVMELIEGETLADRIAKGALPLDQALRFATQIADALDRAHRAGVTHRDVKPANIMLTRDGAKVLDFGLAKSGSSTGPAESTLTAGLTTEGAVLGTPQYMAPEQLEGKEADARSDIWAFGAVLYEMVTGQKAFQGKSYASLAGAILSADPPPMSVQPFTPAWIERLVRRCLAKDPEDRWQSMRDVVVEMRTPPPEPAASGPARAARWSWAIAVAAILLGGLIGAWVSRHFNPPEEPRHISLSVVAPKDLEFLSIAASPDGRFLAFTAAPRAGTPQLWIRALDVPAARSLTNTEGASFPFWSPDSRFIAFFAGGQLKKIPVSGGVPLNICSSPGAFGGTWNEKGIILFGAGFRRGLHVVSASGGDPQPATDFSPSGDNSQILPQFLPDGERFLFTAAGAGRAPQGLYAGSLRSKQVTRILPDHLGAAFVGSSSRGGWLIFPHDSALFAQPFDAGKLQRSGEPVAIAEQIPRLNILRPNTLFSASTSGVIASVAAGGESESQLTLLDRSGKTVGIIGEPGYYGQPSLSPDEKRFVVARQDPASRNYDLWIFEFARNIAYRFTSHPMREHNPVWSPDGRRIAFNSDRNGPFNTFIKDVDASGDGELLIKSDQSNGPHGWSPDGRFLLYGANQTHVLSMSGERKSSRALLTDAPQYYARFSPDGKWIAYSAMESDAYQVFVQGFPLAGAKSQISTEGGTLPIWSADGKEIFYIDGKSRLTAAPVTIGSEFVQAGVPKPLFAVDRGGTRFAVTRDGKRFLLPVRLASDFANTATIIINGLSRK